MKLIARTDLAYTTLVCCCLSLSLIILSTYIAFYNELVHSVPLYMQTYVPFLTLSLSVILKVLAFGSFLYLFNVNLKVTVLSKADIVDGFSTKGKTKLGYSFWLMVSSILLSLISLSIVCTSHHRNTTNEKTNNRDRNNQRLGNDIPMQATGETDGSGMMIF